MKKIYFLYKDDCPHCARAVKSIREVLSNVYHNANLFVRNIKHHKHLKKIYGVRGAPCLIYHDKPYDPIIIPGIRSPGYYRGFLKKFLEKERAV